ncbi:MAG: hypothetical protein R3E12_19165 [Candidatus Eisenbacteria bacterium]
MGESADPQLARRSPPVEQLYRNILDDDPESRDAWLGLATAYR